MSDFVEALDIGRKHVRWALAENGQTPGEIIAALGLRPPPQADREDAIFACAIEWRKLEKKGG